MTNQIVKIDKQKCEMLASFGLTTPQITAINMPTPKCWVKRRVGRGGKKFDYIPVGITIKYLNSIFGFGWNFEVLNEQILEDMGQVLVKGRLTIKIKGKSVIKEQFASKEIAKYNNKPIKIWEDGKQIVKKNSKAGKSISIGDDLKGATSLCLTKCASLFGLFSDIYSSEFYSAIEMPDGKPTVDESIEEIKIDTTKAFNDLVYKLEAVIPKKRIEMSKRVLQTPPFELSKKQIEDMESIIKYAECEVDGETLTKPKPKQDVKPKTKAN